MKRIYSLITIALIIASCGGGGKKSTEDIVSEGDLNAIKAKRSEVSAQYDALAAELKTLDNAISKLDTTSKVSLITALTTKDSLFHHYVELQGNVATKQNLVLNAEYPGTLISVFVKEGDKVRKGQILAKIDDGGLGSQLAQLKVQADLARTTYDRQKRLWDQKIGSEIQFLQAKTQYESTRSAVAQMESQLAKTTVIAPFSGTIDEIINNQGSAVNAGVPVLRIVNLDNMYIEAEVPERYLSSIKYNTTVKVTFPVLGNKIIDAKVRQVSDYINPTNRSFKIEVAVPNTDGSIKPNLTAKVNINDYTNEKAILIPQSIISENADGDQYVYTVSEVNGDSIATAHKTIIKTGKTQGDYVEVLAGIAPGDTVIEEGARRVQDGQKVKILPN